jgi:hypothetical protein
MPFVEENPLETFVPRLLNVAEVQAELRDCFGIEGDEIIEKVRANHSLDDTELAECLDFIRDLLLNSSILVKTIPALDDDEDDISVNIMSFHGVFWLNGGLPEIGDIGYFGSQDDAEWAVFLYYEPFIK